MVADRGHAHPQGEESGYEKTALSSAIECETFAGKVHVEWDPTAAVTPLGQLPFFIEFLKIGNRFAPWVANCPLYYRSNNAPQKLDVLGSLFLSILSGHNRYNHMNALRGDTVNTRLLGMNKIVSDSSAIRALQRMDEEEAMIWARHHLLSCCEPLLTSPWILDVDATVKPLFGHQEGAVVGFNHKKPGRPSHCFHTYMMANTRLILDVAVQPGNQTHSSASMPGLLDLLSRLAPDEQPVFIRGDCDWGNDPVMSELEDGGHRYLFKLRRSRRVQALIAKVHSQRRWTRCAPSWEAKETTIQLHGWQQERRGIVLRKRLNKEQELVIEHRLGDQLELAFLDGPEDMRLYEYAVLVTNLDDEPVALFQHYRDRADCENNFDEIKNQWGWGGYVTRQLQTSRIMASMIALIYNWWNLFVRLAIPDKHHEAITSRPLLLSSVGRLTESGRQRKIVITSHHGSLKKIQDAYERITAIFSVIKANAPQLTQAQCWQLIATTSMAYFIGKDPPHWPALTN